MAKGRIINKCIWKSEKLVQLDPRQRLLWIGLITTADDQGRGRAHPGLVRSEIFPLEDVEWGVIEDSMRLFAEMEMIILYEADDKQLYQILNWWNEQYQGALRWAWPSEYPAPPNWQDRVRHREGNTVTEHGWDRTGGLMESQPQPQPAQDEAEVEGERSHGGPTVVPPRSHGEPTVSPAPNGNGNINGNENTNGSSTTAGAGAREPPNAFKSYEKAGAILNPLAAEQLGDLIDEFERHRQGLPPPSEGAQHTGDAWVRAAIKEAAGAGARISVNYVKAILDRWKVEGFRTPLRKRGGNGRDHGRGPANHGDRYTQDDIPTRDDLEHELAKLTPEERAYVLGEDAGDG